ASWRSLLQVSREDRQKTKRPQPKSGDGKVHVGPRTMRYGEVMARWIERVTTAAGRLARDVREDHAAMNLFNGKYDPRRRPPAPIAKDLVEKIGFQFIAACRVMRFFKDVDAALPARVTSRMIRHLYGSDVHWDA